MINIDKGVDMPPQFKGGSRMYPFDKMNVGDSFYVVLEDISHCKDPAHALSSAARSYAKRALHKTMQFSVRQVRNDDGTPIGVRVWRTR